MTEQDFIQAEYERFCSGKLYFEIIFPDTFKYLHCCGLLQPSDGEINSAVDEVTAYRREVLRKWYFGVNKPLRDNLFPHIDTEAERVRENAYRVVLVQKMLVFHWYEEQQRRGVNKLFLELKHAV